MSEDPSPHDLNDELLSAYIDGELSPELRAQVEERLRTDPPARQLVEELRQLSGAVKSLPREKFAGDLRPRLWAVAEETAESPIAGKIELAPHDHWAGIRRGLAWGAVAIAATLALMVVQPKDDNDNRKLARVDAQNEESAQAKAAPRVHRGPAEMGPAPAATAADAAGEGGEAASQASAKKASDAPASASEAVAPAPSAPPPGDVANDLEAPESASEDRYASRDEASPVPMAPESAAAARQQPVATIDVTARSSDGTATFEKLLAANNISVSDADDADPPLDAVDSQAAGAAVVLVEASAGQLSSVYDALRADNDRFADVQIHDVRGRAEAGQAGGRGGRSFAKSAGSSEPSTVQQDFKQRLAEAGAERKTAESQSTPFGRAWRLQRDDRSSLHALSASSAPPAAAASPQLRRLAPVDQAASTGQRVRVLFVLRALDSDATPAAPAASTAAPETK